jgi:predicted heme/steroid binding protein/uncharacterized membrane protein
MEKEFDEVRLAANDGKEGRLAYISHGGRVIDVSGSPLWAGGIHMGRHAAGRDLTNDIEAAPHGTEVLDRYPEVGRLERKAPIQPALPPFLSALLSRYPFFKRHPHPATVHFPIVLTTCASFFSLLYVLSCHRPFDQTAFYCLIGSLVFVPAGILTGILTWRVNYMALPMRPVTIKKTISLIALPALLVLVVWRAFDPGVLDSLHGASLLYFVLVLAVGPAILIVAAYGGGLTFPIEKS